METSTSLLDRFVFSYELNGELLRVIELLDDPEFLEMFADRLREKSPLTEFIRRLDPVDANDEVSLVVGIDDPRVLLIDESMIGDSLPL